MLNGFGRAALFIIVLLSSSVASFWIFRVARAADLSAADSLADRRTATILVPTDARNWQKLAVLQQQRGVPSSDAFLKATQLSPLSAEAWIGLGLEQEMNGDFHSAEAALLHAAGISREYVPRWTLLNFYFRRNDPEHFWPWARRALELGYTDMQPIFRMAWALTSDANHINREMVPDRPVALGQYLVWLTNTGKTDEAEKVASRLLPRAGQDEAPALEFYCNTQLARGHVAAAKAAWAGMLSRHLVPDAEESPGTAATRNAWTTTLTNGLFTHDPSNTGLDWRKATPNGIFFRPTFPGLRINLSGKQPEACELLSQYVLLEKDRKYDLSYEYETSGIPPDSGLSWRVFDLKTGLELTKNVHHLSREKMGSETIRFLTPSEAEGGRLVLMYQRALGTTRISGWLQLQQVALTTAN
ncbi:MAG: hypothetical protein M3Z32_00040 [Acidobacteriota bacterium]|nr:hypothetical protein [Acidobacteriota bacterium]